MAAHHVIEALVAAVHTPFHPDGSLAPEVVDTQAAFLAANGIGSVFITGTTGEFHSLTRHERLSLYDAWASAGRTHHVRVMAHVGSNSLDDARALARQAATLGFAAVSAVAPSYYKPATMSSLIEWCAAIAAEAPALPFYYYDIPSMTGVTFPVDRFLIGARQRIPNLAGAKFTNMDLVAFRRSLDAAGPREELYWGTDEALLGALATGARVAVGSTYNWAPALYARLMDAFARGNFADAQRLQSVSVAMVDALNMRGFMGSAKALMGRLGVPVGPARAPFDNPARADVDTMLQELHRLGFDTWGARPLP